MAEKENRCWPGYEPVPGKEPHSQGSCKPKAESKSSNAEKAFKTKRKKQLDEWQAKHPKSPRKSAQHLGAPAKKKTSPVKKTSATKVTVKKVAAKKSASAQRSATKKAASRKRA